jgi:hypothetical protein
MLIGLVRGAMWRVAREIIERTVLEGVQGRLVSAERTNLRRARAGVLQIPPCAHLMSVSTLAHPPNQQVLGVLRPWSNISRSCLCGRQLLGLPLVGLVQGLCFHFDIPAKFSQLEPQCVCPAANGGPRVVLWRRLLGWRHSSMGRPSGARRRLADGLCLFLEGIWGDHTHSG